MEKRISVCLITKNESDKLKKCLESLTPYGMEIVVVDTGSTDDTLSVIDGYADVTGSFAWVNDFSKARNFAASLATNDAILVLDSDEWIEACDMSSLENIISHMNNAVGRITRINQIHSADGIETSSECIARFYDRRYFYYVGSIHEQITPIDSTAEMLYEDIVLECGHSGYAGTDEDLDKKTKRNIEMLLAEIDSDGKDAYRLYQLGKSYYLRADYEKAVSYFEEAWDYEIQPNLSYVQDMMECYGYSLLRCDRKADMMILFEMFETFGKTADYCFVTGLGLMNNGLFDDAIEMFIRATTFEKCTVSGTNTYKAWYNAGVICECMGKKSEAKAFYLKCGEFDKAKEAINRL